MLRAIEVTSRSVVIRQAQLDYLSQDETKNVASPDLLKIANMYEEIKDEHPSLDPKDTELVQFLYNMKQS